MPALLTDEGLSFEAFTGPRWDTFENEGFAGFPRRGPGGRRVNVFTPGVALFQAPFFAAGHVIATATGYSTDGFSPPYLILATLGGATYALLGLLVLFVALQGIFSAGVALVTVLVLGLGTNLLYYATFEPLMTHAYSFLALSVVTWATLAWNRSEGLRVALVGGVAMGLAVVVRPTNAVFVLFPLGYLAACRARDGEGREWLPLLRHGAAAGLAAFLATLPLLAYWRFAMGAWVANPHGPGTFYWTDPQIMGVLWGYRKGWFVYTPVMLSVIPGFYLFRRYAPHATIPLFLYAAAHIYVASSYWSWWYGGSFGMRAFIEMSAPLSLCLAALVAWAAGGLRKRRTIAVVLGLLVSLSLFQTYQYVRHYIHWDGMTRETYWAVFLRPSIPWPEMEESRTNLSREGSRRPKAP